MNSKLGFGLAAVAALTLGVTACGKSSSSAIPDANAAAVAAPTLQITIKPTDVVRGDSKAPITFIEYASMTCPHCARWQQEVLPQLIKNYVDTGKVRYIFREFPLDGAARMASALARCEKGDGFYSFIDLLFRNQQQWEKDANGDGQITKEDIDTTLTQMAHMAGMNQQQAETCMNDPKNLAIVDANWQEAQTTYNVQSTPTFIVNGQTHIGEWQWSELDAKLKALLAGH